VFNDRVNDEREAIWENPGRDPIRGLKKKTMKSRIMDLRDWLQNIMLVDTRKVIGRYRIRLLFHQDGSAYR